MNAPLRDPSVADLDRLLSAVVNGVDGAIDFWSLMCLTDVGGPSFPRGFVRENSDRLLGAVREIAQHLNETPTVESATGNLVELLREECESFQVAFLVLAEHGSYAEVRVEQAIHDIGESRSAIHATVRQLAVAVGAKIIPDPGDIPGREEKVSGILAALPSHFRDARKNTG